ncbi:MAG: hypothetical protein ACP5OZ_02785 [Candidatus Woesearchaeota archaeon]
MNKVFLFANITGTFIFDEKLNIITKEIFSKEAKKELFDKSYDELDNFFEEKEKEILEKFRYAMNNELVEIINLRKNPNLYVGLLNKFLGNFSKRDFFEYSRELLFKMNARELSIVEKNTIISQDVDSLKQITKVFNILVKRIREYYSFFCPELVVSIEDDEFLVDELYHKTHEEILNDLGKEIELKAKVGEEDLVIVTKIVKCAFEVKKLIAITKEKIETEISGYCPETAKTATPLIAAKLLKQAGGLKELAMMPSSKIQLLGAEKALFRHLKTGTKPPKYGIIYQHPEVLRADKKFRGKIARKLASQIAMSARKDYFSKSK